MLERHRPIILPNHFLLLRRRAFLAWAISLVAAMMLCAPAPAGAQAPNDSTPPPPVDSPLLPATSTPAPTATPTSTPSPTPTATPTQDLSTAVLQVSPLKLAPDDRPINDIGALSWVTIAALVVLAGAVVMMVAQRRP